jgi:hypothetical protein
MQRYLWGLASAICIALVAYWIMGGEALGAEPESAAEVVAAEASEGAAEGVNLLGRVMTWVIDAADSIISIAILAAIAWISRRVRHTQAIDDAVDALRIGVQQSWETCVKNAKRNAADGKLDSSEREHAYQLAIKEAKKVARGPALRLLATIGEDWLRVRVRELVEERKTTSMPSTIEVRRKDAAS